MAHRKAPPPVPFSRRSEAFHHAEGVSATRGETRQRDAWRRQRWAEIQAEMVRLGQRDFREIWEEPPADTGTDRDACACRVAGPAEPSAGNRTDERKDIARKWLKPQ